MSEAEFIAQILMMGFVKDKDLDHTVTYIRCEDGRMVSWVGIAGPPLVINVFSSSGTDAVSNTIFCDYASVVDALKRAVV